MTIDDYKRNLRGVNDGKDFDPEYLVRVESKEVQMQLTSSPIYMSPSKSEKSFCQKSTLGSTDSITRGRA